MHSICSNARGYQWKLLNFVEIPTWIIWSVTLEQQPQDRLVHRFDWKIDLNLPLNSLKLRRLLLVRKFPKTTPSGLIIGIIFMIALLRKFYIYFPPESKRFIMPLITNEPDTSAGWILPEIINNFFLLFLLAELFESFVIVIMGIARPVKL